MAKRKSCIGRILLAIVLIGIIAAGVLVIVGYTDYKNALEKTPLEQKVAEVRADENYTPLDQMGEYFPEFIVMVEDKRFYEHGAIDPVSMMRAVVTDLRTMSLAEGGSTITQQVAKNLYFTMEKRFTRKIAEAFMAMAFERHYTKDEILELYCNSIFYGNNCYTVKEAAELYYGKTPATLSFQEASMLAGIPQAPSVYNPLADQEKSAERHEAVLEVLADNGIYPPE